MDGGQEGLKITYKVKWEAKPSRFVVEFRNTFLGVLGVGILDVLRRMTLAVGYVAFEGVLLIKGMEAVVADGGISGFGSARDEA